jgi:hypothetical protein
MTARVGISKDEIRVKKVSAQKRFPARFFGPAVSLAIRRGERQGAGEGAPITPLRRHRLGLPSILRRGAAISTFRRRPAEEDLIRARDYISHGCM